jgi:hypothetical protein
MIILSCEHRTQHRPSKVIQHLRAMMLSHLSFHFNMHICFPGLFNKHIFDLAMMLSHLSIPFQQAHIRPCYDAESSLNSISASTYSTFRALIASSSLSSIGLISPPIIRLRKQLRSTRVQSLLRRAKKHHKSLTQI